ncbi:uncharacterized protein [Clytia hemisphaerica]|uniref:BHLH domain-containing protein n=1 Tax=Clytia hemisphaerica TaxID=252671 RepID=A0A069DNK1_9CNID|nr:MIST-a [Clytia hemisphaerica]|eukprot:TCONS_00048084-protein
MMASHGLSEPTDFKLFHMQQQFGESNAIPDQNNNFPVHPDSGTHFQTGQHQTGLLGLPYHCYNYQDFPAFYNTESPFPAVPTKPWRKRVTKKRKLPEKVLRERQLRRNERERARQNRLNDAFDVLRDTIPEFLTPCKKGQKLTQIETLRLAKHYIGSLRELLDGPSDRILDSD